MSRNPTNRRSTLASDGSAVIVGLLLACLILVGVLTWQAWDAGHSHRQVAETVLRDYARLAADEFVRRSSSEVGFYGYIKLLAALHPDDAVGGLPNHESLVATADRYTQRALPLARYAFRLDTNSDRTDLPLEIASDGRQPTAAVAHWLRTELHPIEGTAAGDDDPPPMMARHPLIDGELHSFIYKPDSLIGFEVDREQLSSWFATALSRGPLLPQSLADSADDQDFLLLTVTDATGQEIFRTGDEQPPGMDHPLPPTQQDPYAPMLTVDVPYGELYEGIFDGTRVRVALDPAAAPRLIIGGLPRSRLPTLVGLLLLTAGLLVAAIVQLRRSRDLTRLRSDFVSRVSHELRTPLTQIRMFAETLTLGRVRSDDERDRSLRIIDQEARRLSHLVENILQFSRSERGSIELSPRPHALGTLVRTLVRDFEPVVGQRRVRFVIDDPNPGLIVEVDEDALRQILLNLLDNAVKYGPPEQEIRIRIENGNHKRVRLLVEDQGPGIPQREHHRVWRSFHRLERDRRSAVAGTGIGLAVVHELVTLHGGRVSIEPGEDRVACEDGGACFVIDLPIAQTSEAPA